MRFLQSKFTIALLLAAFGLTANANNLSSTSEVVVYESLEKQFEKLDTDIVSFTPIGSFCATDCFTQCRREHRQKCDAIRNSCKTDRFGKSLGCAAAGSISGGITGGLIGTLFGVIGAPAGASAGSAIGMITGGIGCWWNHNRKCNYMHSNCKQMRAPVRNCLVNCFKYPNTNPTRARGIPPKKKGS